MNAVVFRVSHFDSWNANKIFMTNIQIEKHNLVKWPVVAPCHCSAMENRPNISGAFNLHFLNAHNLSVFKTFMWHGYLCSHIVITVSRSIFLHFRASILHFFFFSSMIPNGCQWKYAVLFCDTTTCACTIILFIFKTNVCGMCSWWSLTLPVSGFFSEPTHLQHRVLSRISQNKLFIFG